MKTTLIFIILLITGITLWSSEAEKLKNDYNDEALLQLLENSQWNDSSEQNDIAYWLYWVLKQKNAPQDKLVLHAMQAINIIEKNISYEQRTAKDFYRLAQLYNGMIVDASSWMKYNSSKEKYLEQCLSLDSAYKDARIFMIRTLLFFPPHAGGDAEKGFKQLNSLTSHYPEDPEILLLFAEYYKERDDNEKAKEYYSQILELNPNHFRADKNYKELILIEKNLPIGNISLSNQTKTKIDRKLDSIKEWESKIYNYESIQEIQNIIYSLPSITGVEIETREIENNTVDLSLNISENNTKIYAFLGGFGVSDTSDNSLSVSGFPAFMYMDQNFCGSGNNFMLTFAGIYLGLDLTIIERPEMPFNLQFHADGLFLPMDYNFIENGSETDWQIKTPTYNASVTLEKSTDFGLLISSYHNLQIKNFSGGISDFTTPDNNLTYTGNMKLAFTTIDMEIPSLFTPPTGFSISVTPALAFKPDYKSWGLNSDLYTHNDQPGWMLVSGLEYYLNPSKNTYFGASLFHYGSTNLYESEKWDIGQTNMMSAGPRLSGYLSGEYRSENALVVNFDGHVQFIPDTLLFFAKHDFFYDVDENLFKQGSALGFALNLPYEIELDFEAGIAWNAQRESGSGWSIQIALSRYFLQ
jgi:tetratricopeptide (TPR) repeat protein